MDLQIKERVAVVTGGTQGIGKASALLLGREGARIGVTYSSQPAKAAAVVAEIEQAGGTALAVPLDLASIESIRAAVGAVLDRWGRIDILVNNALAAGNRRPWDPTPFEDVEVADWRTFLRTNTEGPYAAIQAVLPAMRSNGWGRIVNVSGTSAVDGLPGVAELTTAKAALHGLTYTLARELGPAGILVNVVMPGTTLTERFETLLPPAFREQREQASPIRRLLTPAEVVPAIAFLCSATNTAITGEAIRVSGGLR
jgi:3-oxoacyl-[acyl-carrier protein] reductase